jgi:predicted DNA-binding transcriptional regulator YafY
MSRSVRLIQLLQEIRLHTPPVTAQTLAEAMSVSERTVYRDIQALRGAGAQIEGEAGYGFSLVEDPALPPQVFDREEIEALVLGLKEVQAIADPSLAKAAEHATAKIYASLPPRLKTYLNHAVLHVKKFRPAPESSVDPAIIRQAAWQELAIDIDYRDVNKARSKRRVYPLSIVYMDHSLVLLSYCCLRKATRAFRLDRIESIELTDESFHPKRVRLLTQAVKDVRG